MSIQLRLAQAQADRLWQHMFPGDGDEHGAVIAAAVTTAASGDTRLLAHRVFLAEDGVDYVPGRHGYRALTADYVLDRALDCADLGMAYLAVHCHGGSDTVGFSVTDLESHERGYPAVRDIVAGPPVGGLVLATEAVAGDIWMPGRQRETLAASIIAGPRIRRLHDRPPREEQGGHAVRYGRQVELFGEAGQNLLANSKVGVIGAGGAGSIVVEQLARLGVGQIVVVDPDRIEPSNLSRIGGSRPRDAWQFRRWAVPERWARRIGRRKVAVAKRAARQANPHVTVTAVARDVLDPAAAEQLTDCDYLFLAADTMQARLLVNALVHQYLIPGVQMGVKAQIDPASGNVIDLFAVCRPMRPGYGCLCCNGLIPASRLQEEATDLAQRRRQRYVDDDTVHAPSVITLNGIAVSLATTDFLMAVTGLGTPDQPDWLRIDPRTNESVAEAPRADQSCTECSADGRLGRGSTKRLPIRTG